jgi:quercetin dioxygenase-like cupin family protein
MALAIVPQIHQAQYIRVAAKRMLQRRKTMGQTQYKVNELLFQPGEGETTSTDMRIIGRSAALGGDFSIMEGTVGPKKLLPPHTHEHEDQAVFVIEGELEFEVGGEGGLRFSAGPGSYVLKPRQVEHCVWNTSDTKTVRYIELSGRDGFEKFVDGRKKGALVWQLEANFKLGIRTAYHRIPKLLSQHGLDGIAAANLGKSEEDENGK